MKKIVLILAAVILIAEGFVSQQIYINISTLNPPNGVISILEEDNTVSSVVQLDVDSPIFSDIAISPAGNLYGIAAGGDVWEININNGSSTFIYQFPILVCTSLVCDAESNLYTIDVEGGIYSYNLLSEEAELVYDVDDFTPGDLAFFNGYLVYPATNNPEFLQAFDLSNNEVSTIYCFPTEIAQFTSFYGISNRFDSCGNEMLVVSTSTNIFYSVDVYGDTYENLNVETGISGSHETFGLASISDIQASQCDGFVPEADCAVGIEQIEIGQSEISFHPNPVKEELHFQDNVEIVKVDFFTLTGQNVRSIISPNEVESLVGLSNGYYLLRIERLNGKTNTFKLIKN